MKNLVIISMLLFMAACGVDSSRASYDSIIMLPENKFRVGTQEDDLAASVKALGVPSDRLITIRACNGAASKNFVDLIDALDVAGYKRIAHTTDDDACADKFVR